MGQLVKQGWMSKQGGGHREKSSVMKSFSQLVRTRTIFFIGIGKLGLILLCFSVKEAAVF